MPTTPRRWASTWCWPSPTTRRVPCATRWPRSPGWRRTTPRCALEADADHDARLARAPSGHPVTLAYHFNHQGDPAAAGGGGAARELPVPITEPDVLPASALAMAPWQGVEVPVLLRAAVGTGFINALPDADGEPCHRRLRMSHCRVRPLKTSRKSRLFMNNFASGALHGMRCAGTMGKVRGRRRRRPRALSLTRD